MEQNGADLLHPLFARQNAGSNRNAGPSGSSVSALVSTLVPVLIIASVIFIVFLMCRKKHSRVYQPRTYLDSLRGWQRSPKQTTGFLGWVREYRQLTDEHVLGHASIDNYLWIRFFKMLSVMCVVGALITWPVLFPVNATGGVPNTSGFDVISFAHVNPGPRYFAQALVAWVFLAWVMFMISRESTFFVRLQQHYYLSPYMRARLSTRTVLFINVPEEARSEEFIRRQYAGVRRVWLVSVPEELADLAEERDKAAMKLEGGTIKLCTNVTKRQMKAEKKGAMPLVPPTNQDGTPGSIAVDPKDQPTHRLPVLKILPLGKKVNTIDWSCGELHRLIPEVAQVQAEMRSDRSKAQGACFVEFDSAQSAYNCLHKATLKNETKMTPKEIGATPDTIIWKNIIKPWPKSKLFEILATAFVWFLCIFWAIPVAVIGAISNIDSLTEIVPFLSFINSIPSVILGVVTGLLPVILLAVLMALVPIIMNVLAKLFEQTEASVQVKVQGWYFPFQVIQVFLVTTFASGAAAVVQGIIQNPASAPAMLAKNLPKASNFYISYFVLYGLQSTAMQFLNLVPLLFILVLGKILDKTPRKMFNRYATLGGLGWGSIYPVFTNLGVIALAYSSIAPLILGFAATGFFLLYLGFRYNVLFTLGTKISTRGESYFRALQQLTVGIYLSEICLIGLFAIGAGSNTISVGPLVLMIVWLVVTIVWQVMLGRYIKKLRADLPSAAAEIVPDFVRDDQDVEKYGSSNNGGEVPYHPEGPMSAKSGYTNNYRPQPSMMNRIKGFFAPQKAAIDTIERIAANLSTPARPYTRQEEAEAYLHPAITSDCPIVWVAKDKYGVSGQVVRSSRAKVGEGFEMTDEHAWFNEKGKVTWSEHIDQAPIFENEPAY